MTAIPLWICIHGASHAVAHFVLDELPPYPGPHIRYITVERSEGALGRVVATRGYSHFSQLNSNRRPDSRQNCASIYVSPRIDIVETLAGPVAELWHGYGPWSAMLDGVSLVQDAVAGALDHDQDMLDVRHAVEWLSLDDPKAELWRLWKATCLLVASEWPGMVRAARVLQAKRYMQGDAFEIEWRAARSAPAMRRRLEARWNPLGWREQLVPGETGAAP